MKTDIKDFPGAIAYHEIMAKSYRPLTFSQRQTFLSPEEYLAAQQRQSHQAQIHSGASICNSAAIVKGVGNSTPTVMAKKFS